MPLLGVACEENMLGYSVVVMGQLCKTLLEMHVPYKRRIVNAIGWLENEIYDTQIGSKHSIHFHIRSSPHRAKVPHNLLLLEHGSLHCLIGSLRIRGGDIVVKGVGRLCLAGVLKQAREVGLS